APHEFFCNLGLRDREAFITTVHMSVAIDELPGDVDALKQFIVERERQRESLIAQIREEAARQLEVERERHAAELKAAIAALLRRYYGPRSETFDPRQLLLFGQRIDGAQLDAASIEEEAGEPLTTRRVKK